VFYNYSVSTPILATKLYTPPSRPNVVLRPRLIERLDEGLPSSRTPGVTLISAPAGFGKTTLVSEWVAGCGRPVAWLSLDDGDNDPARFLAYLIAALQTIAANIGEGVLAVLHASQPQPPPTKSILTSLLNEITTLPDNFILVLDDYHAIDSKPVDHALTFLLEHLPLQMHLVIATREDPNLPLARLRAGGQLTELRAADLRFTHSEAAEFLNHVMGLKLAAEDIAALEARTEGWIAGLQLAAISMQGHHDTASFIKSFTGSHHFVMDYLVEEVLQQQSESVQTFLLRTSILDRLCGPLCDAVLLDLSTSGRETLAYLERANLFIVPLDNERRWYRYHHLFADLLRQRLHQSIASSTGDAESRTLARELHIRASQWYEDNGLQIEAFRHAAAANDIERAERLIDGKGIPLHFSGGVVPILDWLASLPKEVLDARPWLWWRHAALLLINGQTIGVEGKLNAAEAALQGSEADEKNRIWLGRIAAARAVLALTRYDVKTMLIQSRRALEYLPPGNPTVRTTPLWTLGYAHFLQGDRAAARQAYTEAISLSQASGDIFTLILATIGLGQVQETDNQLYQAAETYRRILQLAGDKPQQIIHEAHLGLARVLYEWNDLDAAEQHGEQGLQLARQYESIIDRFIVCEVFLARLKLARGEVTEAAAILAKADQSVRQHNFVHRIPEVAAAQVLTLIRQGNLVVAAHLAETHELLLSQARVHLAQGDPSAALAVLESFRQQVEAKGWKDERLKVMVLQAIALHAHGEKEEAVQVLGEALALAEPGGFIRIFVDEGAPMDQLLSEAASQGIMPDYTGKLRAAFEAEKQKTNDSSYVLRAQPLIEPLSQRELEVLQLIAQGLSNHEIGDRLFLALDTVKGHNRKIFDKLGVQRRTEAVARARELGLL
jgi:LuxR family maltose regulon positive regulatory protein